MAKKPDVKELEEYYKNSYLQGCDGNGFNEDEKAYFQNKLAQKLIAAKAHSTTDGKGWNSFLDVGAGHGFAMAFFANAGYAVTGVEFGSDGCKAYNPAQLKNLITGSTEKSINQLAEEKRQFHIILLDNSLEHMLEPLKTLRSITPLLADGGMLIIDVPNDFSPWHMQLLEQEQISNPSWVKMPEHISYFNRDGLKNLAEDAGFKELGVMADFPMEFYCFNEHSNYMQKPELGRQAHLARVEIENMLNHISPEKSIKMYEAMAELQLGRGITSFFGK